MSFKKLIRQGLIASNINIKKTLNYLNPYSPNVTFLYPRKTPENLWFSDVFRVYRNVTLGEYGLMSISDVKDDGNKVTVEVLFQMLQNILRFKYS